MVRLSAMLKKSLAKAKICEDGTELVLCSMWQVMGALVNLSG